MGSERPGEDPMARFDALLKAATAGNPDAQNQLGDAYAKGEGIVPNPRKAVEWYSRSAAQGQAEAIGNLGICKLCGDGVTRDPAEGARLISESIKKGNVSGRNLYQLASCYESGEGVSSDRPRAMELYRESASKGYFKANAALRRLLKRG